MKSACFLTGGVDICPIGGYKVVYEYANRLVRKGWDVAIVYPMVQTGNLYPRFLFRHPKAIKQLWRYWTSFRHGKEDGGSWFPLDSRVKKIYPLQNSPRVARRLPQGTKFIATYIPTVVDLNRFDVPESCKFNFVQGFEAWGEWTSEKVFETYRYPMTKIAISQWLADTVAEAGAKAIVVPNGLDFEYFRLSRPISERAPASIAMLWHIEPQKRTEDIVEALKIVRKSHPELQVTAFGATPAPSNLPEWINYHHRPDRELHNRIYNEASIFVAASEQEGWGLTPCEAMQCGAAVVCTDIGGYRMFAKNGETALMSPARDPQALAANICRLIEDNKLRIRIAEAGNKNIHQFAWDSSVTLFESVLNGEV